MFCSRCGQSIPDQSKFCSACGAQSGPQDKQGASCCYAKKALLKLVIGVALAAVIIAVAAGFFKKSAVAPAASAGASAQATQPKNLTPKIILLISEQNIEGPQRCWWASEIDLSTTEGALAQRIMQAGFEILEPSQLRKVVNTSPAFRLVSISDNDSVRLGNLSRAQYVVLGKAIASAGGNVPQSSMRSCFANVTAKLIRVKDGKVVAYLDAAGNSAHMDVVTGGREALSNAGDAIAAKIIAALNSEVGKK
jgi:hypothetical protein